MAYILLAKKGDPIPIFEEYRSSTELLKLEDTLNGSHDRGFITSTLIGPADKWGTFYRNVGLPENGIDKYQIRIVGVNLEGNNVDTLNIPSHDTLDLTTVPTLSQYPYIKLLAEIKDTFNLTAPQLNKWQVIYSGVPEGTMNPSLVDISQYNNFTKQEGDTVSLCYAFENISNYDFPDSLTVRYTITNSNSGATVKTVKVQRLKQDSVVTFCGKFPTVGLEGNNIIQAYVNPRVLKEEYYTNNVMETSFKVEKDKTHPVLDVVFDGVHILDGDIVSPSPMITITLYDENKFMLRNSSDDIEVFIQRPGESIPQRIDQGNSDFVGARQVGADGKNVYQIDYNPKNLPDGIYTIVVRGKDLAGNTSGVQDYTITFEVINESTITNFYPYPNPFSTSTRFVFTLTGGEVPEDLKIQIMTVTGKVVREITKEELGPIRIGNNKTEYAWDGRDEFGDKLANGVYLYRVILKNGGGFKHRESAGDKAFKKNFGKLYILR
jgi:flagellar hook assembly protein FlgD